jgi:hypothetical protein
LLSSFAFDINLRRYDTVRVWLEKFDVTLQ